MRTLAIFFFISLFLTTFEESTLLRAQDKVKLANYKIKIDDFQVESFEILLSKSIEASDWNDGLTEHMSKSIVIASKNKKRHKFTLRNLVIYFAEMKVELNPDFKDYGKGKGVFFFYFREGDELIKIKSVKAIAETKLGYLPRLLLEKALGNLSVKEVEQSLKWRSQIEKLEKDILRIESIFKPNYESQKPGIYMFFEDLKSNEPYRLLSDDELAKIIPKDKYLSVFMDIKLENKEKDSLSLPILSSYWGIFTGKEYLALIDNVLVKLHEKDDNLAFPAYALELQVVSNPPASVHMKRVISVLLIGPLGLVDVGLSAGEASRRRNNPSLDKRFYILNKKYGHFNYTFKEEE